MPSLPGPAVAHPPHRFTQEVGGAAGGVGAALAQTGHQHVAGAGGHGQQRVIAPLAGVAMVARPFLGQSVGFADGGIQVDGERRVAGSCTGGLGPGQQLPAHPIQLADVAPRRHPPWGRSCAASGGLRSRWRQLSRRYAIRRRRQCSRPQPARRPPGSASCLPCSPVPAHLRGQRGCRRVPADPGAGRGSPEGAAQHWPPSGGRRRRFECGRSAHVAAPIGCSLFLAGFLFQNHYPRSPGAPFCRFRTLTRRPPSVDSGLEGILNATVPKR